MKKILLMGLSLVLVAVLAVGGTFAYLTDTDETVNVMTLGNVDIEQHEYERAVNADGTYKTDTVDGQNSYVLKDFTQAKPLLPIVGDPTLPNTNPAYAGYDSIPVRMSQVDSYGGMDAFAGKNAVDKFVTVENKGKTDAYVRTIVAIEVGSETDDLIGSSYHKTWTKNEIGIVNIDGTNYDVIEYVYAGGQLSDGSWRHGKGILPAGDTSYPNLSQVYIKSAAKNEDMVAIDGNRNGTLDILVLSQAVQAEGFDSAAAALEAGFGVANAANVQDWFKDIEVEGVVYVNNTAGIEAALNAGNNYVVLKPAVDGTATTYDIPAAVAGKDVTIAGTKDTVIDFESVQSVNGAALTFNGVTIQGPNANVMNGFGIQGTTEKIVYENCTFDGAVTNEYFGDVEYINCTFTGTGYITTYAVGSATFTGCTFDKADSRAVLVYSHGDNPCEVKLTDCTFKAAARATTWQGDWTSAIEVDTTNIPTEGTSVTITNCTYDSNYSGLVRDKSAAGKANAVITVDGVIQ